MQLIPAARPLTRHAVVQPVTDVFCLIVHLSNLHSQTLCCRAASGRVVSLYFLLSRIWLALTQDNFSSYFHCYVTVAQNYVMLSAKSVIAFDISPQHFMLIFLHHIKVTAFLLFMFSAWLYILMVGSTP